jgi:hypothetical protein
MKTPPTSKTNRPIELNLDPEIENTGDEPLIEIEIPEPNAMHEPDTEHRKKEASKPLYLIRYE